MQQDQFLLIFFIAIAMIVPGLAILFDDTRFRDK